MTPIHRAQIDHPMAWRGAAITNDAIAFDLTSTQPGRLPAEAKFRTPDAEVRRPVAAA